MTISSRQLLDTAYDRLGYREGELIATSHEPNTSNATHWIENGDWLSLANTIKAEKVFFVKNYPVIVFAEQALGEDDAWVKHFNSAWCMARPQLLFLARDGELAVYNLTRPPVRPGAAREKSPQLLDVVRTAAEVQKRLAAYRREQIESGRLFAEKHFGIGDRADQALIRDLASVRQALIESGLPAEHTHALIGRSIFIRYLEDRGVLTEAYFRDQVAKKDKEWIVLLNDDTETVTAAGDERTIYYPRVLKNKLFTFALFKQLAKTFNGDMFPLSEEEQLAVRENHLALLREFLLGRPSGKLFFYAYRFDVIPIELISSIYEQFYSTQPNQKRAEGSYYTPSALVEFVLSQTLDEDLLAKKPRVIDPACGSGIFLVETFRRIVRHRVRELGRELTRDELRTILRDQVRGIDINREAVRVAAFSLYLALLHYCKPRDILQHKLPSLTYAGSHKAGEHFDILLVSDAFGVEANVPTGPVRDRFGSGCADVVVGNPPWSAVEKTRLGDADGSVQWCKSHNLAIGDKERSQSFIHRTMDLLVPGGRAGLLVSTGVLFKQARPSQLFRKQWLRATTLRQVVNFAAVRKAFFQISGKNAKKAKGASSPFAAVVFDNTAPKDEAQFSYWSAKESAFIDRAQAVILSRADHTIGRQRDYLHDEALWKIYWWGNHRDEALIRRLRMERTLGEVLDPTGKQLQQGFIEGNRKEASGWLRQLQELPSDSFERYGALPKKLKTPPTRVERRRDRVLYKGPRLLIGRGVGTDETGQGRITARYETEPFCYRHSIYGLPLGEIEETNAKAVLAILWSSLTRYYLFMTSGTWGLWHDEVLKGTLAAIPLRFPEDVVTRDAIVRIVDQLREMPEVVAPSLLELKPFAAKERTARIRELEAELDNAVFDLFRLTIEEQERITEMCTLGLSHFYRGMESDAVKPIIWPNGARRYGYAADLAANGSAAGGMRPYLTTFLQLWEPLLRERAEKGRFRWRVIQPPESSMMAVIFATESHDDQPGPPTDSDEQAWNEVITALERQARQMKGTNRIYIDGLVRIVRDTDIVIIKRNEHRLWTASTARNDAEATMLQTMTSLLNGDS